MTAIIEKSSSCEGFLLAKRIYFFVVFLAFLLQPACLSHLRQAKYYYVQGQQYSRSYQEEKAAAAFKRAVEEAELEAEKNPSAQALMVKGMAELELGLWQPAEESFLRAFDYGFEQGEEWAKEVALLGTALSFQEMGLERAAFKIYAFLTQKSKLKQILLVASQKYSDILLSQALHQQSKDRQKLLNQALKSVQKLADKNLSCGFFHYLLSQIYGHLTSYWESFEEGVMAKELGLPSEKIKRDNDLQIIFCFQQLKKTLVPEEWKKFQSTYLKWLKKWGWADEQTPPWKRR